MIRVQYSNGEVQEYPTIKVAKFMILNQIFASRGQIVPVEAADVFGMTASGVIVERPLTIKLGVVELE